MKIKLLVISFRSSWQDKRLADVELKSWQNDSHRVVLKSRSLKSPRWAYTTMSREWTSRGTLQRLFRSGRTQRPKSTSSTSTTKSVGIDWTIKIFTDTNIHLVEDKDGVEVSTWGEFTSGSDRYMLCTSTWPQLSRILNWHLIHISMKASLIIWSSRLASWSVDLL